MIVIMESEGKRGEEIGRCKECLKEESGKCKKACPFRFAVRELRLSQEEEEKIFSLLPSTSIRKERGFCGNFHYFLPKGWAVADVVIDVFIDQEKHNIIFLNETGGEALKFQYIMGPYARRDCGIEIL